MKNSGLGLVLSFCLALLVVSGWLVVNPATAFAGSCCAECPGGYARQCCFGQNCNAQDGVGCSANNGGEIIERLCTQRTGGGDDEGPGPILP